MKFKIGDKVKFLVKSPYEDWWRHHYVSEESTGKIIGVIDKKTSSDDINNPIYQVLPDDERTRAVILSEHQEEFWELRELYLIEVPDFQPYRSIRHD